MRRHKCAAHWYISYLQIGTCRYFVDGQVCPRNGGGLCPHPHGTKDFRPDIEAAINKMYGIEKYWRGNGRELEGVTK